MPRSSHTRTSSCGKQKAGVRMYPRLLASQIVIRPGASEPRLTPLPHAYKRSSASQDHEQRAEDEQPVASGGRRRPVAGAGVRRPHSMRPRSRRRASRRARRYDDGIRGCLCCRRLRRDRSRGRGGRTRFQTSRRVCVGANVGHVWPGTHVAVGSGVGDGFWPFPAWTTPDAVRHPQHQDAGHDGRSANQHPCFDSRCLLPYWCVVL